MNMFNSVIVSMLIMFLSIGSEAKKYEIVNDCPHAVEITQMTLDTYLNCDRKPQKIASKKTIVIDEADYGAIYYSARSQKKVKNTDNNLCDKIGEWTFEALRDEIGYAGKECYVPAFTGNQYSELHSNVKLCGC
jgi:hypothetical protein